MTAAAASVATAVFFNLTESYESSSYHGFDKRLGSYVSRR